jgi:hypothetical protein
MYRRQLRIDRLAMTQALSCVVIVHTTIPVDVAATATPKSWWSIPG